MRERFSLSHTSVWAHVSSNARWAAMAGGRFASASTARPGPSASTACWSALVTIAKRSYPHTRVGSAAGSCTSAYKRPDPFRGQRVLVVGAGNSAADIAVDVASLASRAALSMREGTYFIPKRMFGWPIDVVHAFWSSRLPDPLLQSTLKLWLRLVVGRWEDYGLPAPPTRRSMRTRR